MNNEYKASAVPGIVILSLGVLCIYLEFKYWSSKITTSVTHYDSGAITKSGEFYSANAYTCAVNKPEAMDKWYRVQFGDSHIYVYANDLMDMVARKDPNLQLDLTPAAFSRLAPLARGRIECRVEEAK